MLTISGRRFRLRLKTSVTAVLLISVFISSSLLLHSAHAQTIPPATVTLDPNVGSCNPFANTLANSEHFLYASGYEDLSSSLTWPSGISDSVGNVQGPGQLVGEAAIYANGNEPMATAIASASAPSLGSNVMGSADAELENWQYLIFNKTTGRPFDSPKVEVNIPVDLNYSFSMTPTGGDALAQGFISFGVSVAGIGTPAVAQFAEGIGPYQSECRLS